MEEIPAEARNSPSMAAKIRAFTFCLSRSRFSVIILVIGFAMLMSDQGRDILTTYAEDKNTWWVAIWAAIWAVSIWGWSRTLLDINFVDPPSARDCYIFWRTWMPRFLGTSAFIAAAAGAWSAGQTNMTLKVAASAVLFLVFISVRRWLIHQAANMLESYTRFDFMVKASARLKQSPKDAGTAPMYDTLCAALGFTAGRLLPSVVAIVMAVSFWVVAAFAIFNPVGIGSYFGAMILFFIWGATWLPYGSFLSYVADRYGFPLLSTMIALALAFSFINDNHQIRNPKIGPWVDSRMSVSEAMSAWSENNKQARNEEVPFVVVATAGGGIRAAYWTATVLGELHDDIEPFDKRLFAVSGVSGGSVGATVYRALLDIPQDELKKTDCGGVKKCSQEILGNDFIGPVIAAALYPDLAQRFWPWPWFPDRSKALEKGWEQAFKTATGRDRMNDSLGLLPSKPQLPSLFLNATWADNGRRIVASNLKFDKKNVQEAFIFSRSNDQLAILGHDLRLSTAAHNSARFPYVSPPGMWKHKDDKTIAGRLQDGGLFENYGAETALEILQLACKKFACPGEPRKPGDSRLRIKPVVVLISSDPTLPKDFALSKEGTPSEFAYEIRTTLKTYEQCRGGHAAEAAARLEEWTALHGNNFATFRMCEPNKSTEEPPLGWALSNVAQKTIDSYIQEPKGGQDVLPCNSDNRAERDCLVHMISPSGRPYVEKKCDRNKQI
jgi:hypothetical protein